MNEKSATARGLIHDVRRRFEDVGLADADQDSRILVMELLGLSHTDLVLRGDRAVSDENLSRVEQAVLRRLAREPVYRILGSREFYGLELKLSSGTLEPRPDTEVLVDAVLPYLRNTIARQGRAEIVDLGTGTGAIALALIADCSDARAVGVDISEDALKTAAANAAALGLGARFATRVGPWFAQTSESFDIIVSNPPYIRTEVMADLEPEVANHDPAAALDGGPDGLDAYRAIAKDASAHLKPEGIVGLEIGYDQHDEVKQVFEQAGFFLVEARRDHGGRDRVLIFSAKRD
ncbi:peptide chain release factor N(5)-glutamine methyltransferase [Rhizobium wuzhouense]|uniref:Release factor glutamine methyltransferase n=1 Tax=Rhizobium wuzhouense TaxID=1986026 RepID=A0ABX5NRI2_9HYPH|nr:peptide chain release factor N(5)-glutamine methyltransferase [Rhizobium wuzhouense]PYB73895.1 peptide chain release factor N(5)-glutamine methyltransferase [Rhizobium wuzhouense]